MAKQCCYGDELCIQALSVAYQVPLIVYQPDRQVQKFCFELNSNACLPIGLAYNGTNHFVVLYKGSFGLDNGAD